MVATRLLGSSVVVASLLSAGAFAQETGDGLFASATEVRPLLVGTVIPDGTLKDQAGKATSVGALRGDGPAVFIFYRGHW